MGGEISVFQMNEIQTLILPNDPVEQLWLRCIQGEKKALAEIATVLYKPLYHYGTKFTRDQELIRDCIQDLFLEVWEKRTQMQTIRNPRSYLFRSFRNNLLRRERTAARFTDVFVANEEYIILYDEAEWLVADEPSEDDERVRKFLAQLPKRQREALYLRYYENLTYEEIAGVMGLQRQAVANYIQYGLRKLREYWQQVVVSLLCFLFG